jgi:hypothetical protein
MLGLWAIIGAGNSNTGTVTLSGETVSEFGVGGNQTAGIDVRTDGTIFDRRTGGYSQIDSSTDWIIPNGAASSLYEVRVTNVVFGNGSWFTNAAADDAWVFLTEDREWSVRDTDSGASSQNVTFDLEIRYNGGATLASTSYSLIANWDST